MVWVKNSEPTYKHSFKKKIGYPLYYNAKTRSIKQEDSIVGLVTPKYSKGREVKQMQPNKYKITTEVREREPNIKYKTSYSLRKNNKRNPN